MTDIRMPMFGDPVGPWHRWFAWLPVRTYDQRFVWLRSVWRRGIQKHHYLTGGADFWFQHSAENPEPIEIAPSKADVEELAACTTPEHGLARIERWPEGIVFWYHGQIVWRSWQE